MRGAGSPDNNWTSRYCQAARLGKQDGKVSIDTEGERIPIPGSRSDERSRRLWASGSPSCEFFHVEDAARALLLCVEQLDGSEPVNVGTGTRRGFRDLAETSRRLEGFEAEIVWDTASGPPALALPRRLPAAGADRLGAELGLEEGLERTVEGFGAQAWPPPATT